MSIEASIEGNKRMNQSLANAELAVMDLLWQNDYDIAKTLKASLPVEVVFSYYSVTKDAKGTVIGKVEHSLKTELTSDDLALEKLGE